jgi:hypothetical protein
VSQAIKHKAVSSSNLHSVGYDPDTQTLEITFSSGVTYQYQDVPEYIYQELLAAESKGTYFRQTIRGNYPTLKVG